jgi:hypothetical protein
MGLTPFSAIYGRTPRLYNEPIPDPKPWRKQQVGPERPKKHKNSCEKI